MPIKTDGKEVSNKANAQNPATEADDLRRITIPKSLMDTVVTLRVSICNSVPTIWRHIKIGAWMNLEELHRVIQQVFPWYDQHPHAFKFGSVEFAPAKECAKKGSADESSILLAALLAANIKQCFYEYDFGDSWLHCIEILGAEPLSADNTKPRCIAGERAGPPEDIGGIFAYHEIMKILAAPNHPEGENLRECIVGESFQPEHFSVEEANERINRYRWRKA